MASVENSAALDRLRLGLMRHEAFQRGIDELKATDSATFSGVWGSSCALLSASLADQAPSTVIAVFPEIEAAERLLEEEPLFSTKGVDRLSAWETMPGEQVVYDEIFGDRLRVLKLFCEDSQPPRLLSTSIQSLLQPLPDAQSLAARTLRLSVDTTVDPDELARWLVAGKFHHTTAVELPGEFAFRGGIIDIFAPDQFDPVRVEFFGDQIESIRRFEVSSQRSLKSLEQIDITALTPDTAGRSLLTDHLHDDAWFLLFDPGQIEKMARGYLERTADPDRLYTYNAVMREILKRPTVVASPLAEAGIGTPITLPLESVESFGGEVDRIRTQLEGAAAEDQTVWIVCPTEAEIHRLSDLFGQTQLSTRGLLHYTVGSIHEGFRLTSERTIVLGSDHIFRRSELRRSASRRLGKVIDSFVELRPGDLVVHVSHGVAVYRGLKLLEREGHVEEHMVLEFQGKTILYVPTSKVGLVQKYVGGKTRPKLAKIGGKTWAKRKERVEAAVRDLAADMLELQAYRHARPGIQFPEDSEWQRQFDASFPFTETEDQLSAIQAIGEDMRRGRPMDRLLCGDVGFGKTEVSMRAAFKAVDAGYQVAVLVPTTVLAEQHRRTFQERMGEYPFEIESLSRFSTRAQQKKTLERLAAGEVDIIIGTHRLVQKDVRFHNLGLVIIDEEQRFGVEVKERLKTLRTIVDVMTMTATPIPRTLHLGLLGVRDISNLSTPPEDRLAVETRVARFDGEMIRNAVMRELNRDGQIFFVHNRVKDIEVIHRQLKNIVPEARIQIGHGQMAEGELERVMSDFVNHKFDLLLATTIVESGLDIPNANTIFIDEADRYGLADLHQLRGRVGRYKHRAYCYLLIDPHKSLTPTAAKRIRAIEEFGNLGAGFAIAMRDLEIRGAGNILGTEQSGHIATVGYELYCMLLEQAVRKLKKLPPVETVEVAIDLPVEAHIPDDYVPDMRLKIDLYRRLARARRSSHIDDFRSELLDRFGAPPQPVESLLVLQNLRIAAHDWGISTIHTTSESGEPYLSIRCGSPARLQRLANRSRGRLRVVDALTCYYPMEDNPPPEEIVRRLHRLLDVEQ